MGQPHPRAARPAAPGVLGLLHPFPSSLNAAAAAAFAFLAGGSTIATAGAAAAMLLLQTAIGAANDVFDIRHDRMARPEKPLVGGTVSRGAAACYAIVAAGLGLLLAALLAPAAAVVAVAGLAAGLAYDARLSRTPLSWVPFAAGLPLVPTFGWVAARASLPVSIAALIPLGAAAGLALSLANGLVDLEDDAVAGRATVAVALGRRNAHAAMTVVGISLAVLVDTAVQASHVLSVSAMALAAAGSLLLVGGLGLSAASGATLRERGWEAQALAVALLGLAWILVSEPGLR